MGYYGVWRDSPLVLHCMTHRRDQIYLLHLVSSAQEEAMMAIALNRIYSILRQQVSEIVDFLPMEALGYKAAIISIDKAILVKLVVRL